MLKKSIFIEVKNYIIIAYKDDGEVKKYPNFGINGLESLKYLSNLIHDCPFDIDQGGNLKKSEEAKPAYNLSVVSYVL